MTTTRVTTIDRAIQEWAMNYRPPLRCPGDTSAPKEVANALKEIRRDRLYREHFDDFYVYCARRFGMRPERVDQLMHNTYIEAVEQSGKQKDKRRQYVYFMQGAGLVKIGVANDVGKRMRDLQCGSPILLSLIGFMVGDERHEKDLHVKFAHLRQHGEWFLLNDEITSFIESNCDLGDEPIYVTLERLTDLDVEAKLLIESGNAFIINSGHIGLLTDGQMDS